MILPNVCVAKIEGDAGVSALGPVDRTLAGSGDSEEDCAAGWPHEDTNGDDDGDGFPHENLAGACILDRLPS